MDVYHMDSSSISSTMVDPDASAIDEITEVKFEAHQEFDLNFFDTPDDSMTQGAFSNPNSVDSSTSPTPEPLLPLTPTAIANLAQQSITSSNVTINQQQQHQNMAQPAMVNVKNGKATARKQLKRLFLRNNSLPYALDFAKLHHDAVFLSVGDSGFSVSRVCDHKL